MHKIACSVDSNEKSSFIRKVRAGSNPNSITLIIRQSNTSDCFVIWGICDNSEMEAYDTGTGAHLFYDSNGDEYICEND